MPDTHFGSSQVPSARPPEPPYRQGPDLAQTVVASPHHSSQEAIQVSSKQKPGGLKTFLYGFLGALIACILCFAGFMGWQTFSGSSLNLGTTGSATTLGSTEQSVINAADEDQTLAEAVAAKALPSVVAVYNYQRQQTSDYGFGYGYGYGQNNESSELTQYGMGSGVVLSTDGYIITNYHVVQDAEKLTVSVNGVERDAEYVGGDSSSDIAVVKVSDTSDLVAADIGDSDSLKIGEWVMTIGAPLGLEQSVATGVISATNRSYVLDNSSSSTDAYGFYTEQSTPEYSYYPNMIQTDAVINPGNSGGAMVDSDGKLIGINAMISSYSGDYAGVGFAIPINYAIAIAEDIIAGKEPSHAVLGVSISQVNSEIAQRYNLSSTSGAYIAGITPNTGAASSDLQVGDIITAINGKAVSSTTDVTLDVREHKVGDTVTVTVIRDGETKDVDVVLSSDEDIVSTDGSDSSQDSSGGQGSSDNSGNGESGGSALDQFMDMFGL